MAKEKAVKEKAVKEKIHKEKETEKPSKKKANASENPILKLDKPTKVELQNILFGTSEKKLMVSDDFLNGITIKYISKRMKIINTAFSNLHTTRSTVFFFKNTAEIEKYIEDLIILEKYYPFKNPVPSIYKRNYLAHKPAAISGMINRVWKSALQKYPLKKDTTPEEISPEALEFYDKVITELLSQKENFSEEDMKMLDSFYTRVHGEQSENPLDQSESPEENEFDEENLVSEENQNNFELSLDGSDT